MINDFITKCNFDPISTIVKVGKTSLNIDGYKFYDPFTLDEDFYFNYLSFDKFCLEQKIDQIDFLSVNSSNYEHILKTEIINKTQYIYLEYFPPENRDSFELPGKGWSARFDTGNSILFENFVYLETLIKPSGAWNSKNTNEHLFDSTLAYCILNFLHDNKISSCIDLGCGDGSYTKYFSENGILTEGYDGNLFTKEMTNGLCNILDLSVPCNLGKKYQCVMSLEVGEHIPKCYEQIFINNIITHADNLVILSWAVPGQGGHGHVNCADNSYIKDIFNKQGFVNRSYIENILRQAATQTWFHNTVMVFQKEIK